MIDDLLSCGQCGLDLPREFLAPSSGHDGLLCPVCRCACARCGDSETAYDAVKRVWLCVACGGPRLKLAPNCEECSSPRNLVAVVDRTLCLVCTFGRSRR